MIKEVSNWNVRSTNYSNNIIDLKEIKSYLKIDSNYDDEYLQELVDSGIETAEKLTNLSLGIKEVSFNIDISMPCIINLPVIPFLEIVKAYITETRESIVDCIKLTHGATALSVGEITNANIMIVYKTGYDKKIPASIKQSICSYISEVYEKNYVSGSLLNNIKNILSFYREVKI